LPLSLGVTIFFGGIIRTVVNFIRKDSSDSAGNGGVLGAAGLITGEALMGIGFAVLIVSGITLKSGFTSSLLGLVVLVAVALWLIKAGKK
jgi:uncharacterized oligopeptide transporter (OPT) family protein